MAAEVEPSKQNDWQRSKNTHNTDTVKYWECQVCSNQELLSVKCK